MARASKTTTSTTINKHHFLFSFFILVTNSNPEQDRQFVFWFSVFWYSIYRISAVSCAQLGRKAGYQKLGLSVAWWDSRIGRQLDRGRIRL
jgi:hypothetical protein